MFASKYVTVVKIVVFCQEHALFSKTRMHVFHSDITTGLHDNIPDEGVHIATMLFVLSSIHPQKMLQALCNVFQVFLYAIRYAQ